MIVLLIICCLLYIAWQVFLIFYGKYEEAVKLDKEYSELVNAEDCSVCLHRFNPKRAHYCETCNGGGYRKLNFREIEFESFKYMKNKEVTDGNSE